jgi:hypothetical protein
MLRRMSMHAAGIEEPAEVYVWENLSAPEIQSGAATGFTLFTPKLRQYAIAGVLHLDHLAALANSAVHRRLLRRTARETGWALGENVEETEAKLVGLLARHCREWREFLKMLGADSFVARFASIAP